MRGDESQLLLLVVHARPVRNGGRRAEDIAAIASIGHNTRRDKKYCSYSNIMKFETPTEQLKTNFLTYTLVLSTTYFGTRIICLVGSSSSAELLPGYMMIHRDACYDFFCTKYNIIYEVCILQYMVWYS